MFCFFKFKCSIGGFISASEFRYGANAKASWILSSFIKVLATNLCASMQVFANNCKIY